MTRVSNCSCGATVTASGTTSASLWWTVMVSDTSSGATPRMASPAVSTSVSCITLRRGSKLEAGGPLSVAQASIAGVTSYTTEPAPLSTQAGAFRVSRRANRLTAARICSTNAGEGRTSSRVLTRGCVCTCISFCAAATLCCTSVRGR